MTLVLIALGTYMAITLHRFHKQDGNNYDLWDLLMEHGKASLTKHLTLFFAGLTAWTVVKLATADKPVETLLLGALGFFLAKGAIQSFAPAPMPTPPAEENKG